MLTDNDPMPYGIHKGKALANVPASYLLWLYKWNQAEPAVRAYIEDNLDILENERRASRG